MERGLEEEQKSCRITTSIASSPSFYTFPIACFFLLLLQLRHQLGKEGRSLFFRLFQVRQPPGHHPPRTPSSSSSILDHSTFSLSRALFITIKQTPFRFLPRILLSLFFPAAPLGKRSHGNSLGDRGRKEGEAGAEKEFDRREARVSYAAPSGLLGRKWNSGSDASTGGGIIFLGISPRHRGINSYLKTFSSSPLLLLS